MNKFARAAIHAYLRKLDPGLTPDDDAHVYATLLLASYFIGAAEGTLAEELGFDLEFVQAAGQRLRAAKIWVGEENAFARAYEGEELGGATFWMHVSVASGDLESKDGESFKMTPQGIEKVERMGKGAP